MSSSGSIGVFDSGIGGLAITQEIRKLLPNEDIIYVADSLHAPYGEKNDAFILQRCMAITEYLISQNVKAIVVACNTATTSCIEALRERYSIPFIGTEPGIKPAVLNTKTGIIGVLATPRTLKTTSFSALADRVALNIQVELMPCPDLVQQVESLKLDYDAAAEVVRQYVQPLTEKGVDTLVLGCTHYAHLLPVISRVAGPQVRIINTEVAVAKEVMRRLNHAKLNKADLKTADLNTASTELAATRFITSGNQTHFQKQVDVLWGAGFTVAGF
ncbi:glutamate racemase [Aliidiomarina shirensis]|uniref:Glutamate racemase n=1 Tax=Aliidiomarina shirensis TaxID=1048642 RepID=A0A432WWT0_9GAMM|nr:glutamate racemase [Aliidiomarina shirensis]RUO38187.1 glutamate racemase [Aliidiomarina shirensis]